MGVAQDVTQTIMHDQALNDAARDLRLLVSTANVPIFGCDVDLRVNIWNKRTADLTGYSRSEAMGKPVSRFFDDSIKNAFVQVQKGNDISNFETQFVCRNHNVRHLLINFSCRTDEGGAVVTGGLAVSQDITENALRDR